MEKSEILKRIEQYNNLKALKASYPEWFEYQGKLFDLESEKDDAIDSFTKQLDLEVDRFKERNPPYIIFKGNTPEELTLLVREAVVKGYSPAGGIAISLNEEGLTTYNQAVYIEKYHDDLMDFYEAQGRRLDGLKDSYDKKIKALQDLMPPKPPAL